LRDETDPEPEGHREKDAIDDISDTQIRHMDKLSFHF